MKLLQNKIVLGIGLVGLLIMAIGVSLLFPTEPAGNYGIADHNMTFIEIVGDGPLRAELEALKSKTTALEQDIGGLVLENEILSVELRQSLARVAELSANQQPELSKHYTDLQYKYNQNAMALINLEIAHDALVLEYEGLVRIHALCGED